MAEAKVIFTLYGDNLTIQCSKMDKMRDICQKYATKVNKNIDSLVFLYGGNQINFNLSFNEQSNSLDRNNNIMRVLVDENDNNRLICPKCGEKIKLKIEELDNIIISYNEINDTINGIKSQIDNIIIDDEILSNIANRIDSNIRELEGTLNKLIATSSLTNSPITKEMAEKAINDIVAQQEKVISAEFIQETVAKYFNINAKDLRGSKRSNDIAFPRQIAMYLCRKVAQMSLPQIGKDFGKRDHTTVMHACNKVEKEIKENQNTKLIVESVEKILLSDE